MSEWAFGDELDVEWVEDAASFDVSALYHLPTIDVLALFFNLTKEEISRNPVSVDYFGTTIESGLGYAVGRNPTVEPTAAFYTQDDMKMSEVAASFANEATAAQCRTLFNTMSAKAKNTTPGIAELENKYVKNTTDGKIYRVLRKRSKVRKTLAWTGAADIVTALNDLTTANTIHTADGEGAFSGFSSADPSLRFTGELFVSRYVLEEVPQAIGATIPAANARAKCYDSPYDIFCMPYSDTKEVLWQREISTGTQLGSFICNKNVTLAFASELAEKLGSSQIYDLQLLPFCPVPAVIESDGSINTRNWPTTLINSYSDDGSVTPVGALIWCLQSSGEFRVAPPANDANFALPQTSMEYKVANQCDMFRLCSPTDASVFEFSLTKNRGISYFNVTYTYRPFQPYIHIAPEFAGLYGDTFEKEKRGLILRGDFSLSKTSSDWANYKANNSNYEAIFNRQIENMEVQNRYQRKAEQWQVIGGIAQGAASGAFTGSVLGGGPIGAVAGALGGAAISGFAGAKDIEANEALRKEQIDYTRDIQEMNLQAIKARPLTLTNISAFDIDSSPFPIVEYYSCSETEKEAFRNKLRYNGMSVLRIGALGDFSYNNNEPNTLTYIKGTLIRLTDVPEDYHIVNEMAKELNKGVFI